MTEGSGSFHPPVNFSTAQRPHKVERRGRDLPLPVIYISVSDLKGKTSLCMYRLHKELKLRGNQLSACSDECSAMSYALSSKYAS